MVDREHFWFWKTLDIHIFPFALPVFKAGCAVGHLVSDALTCPCPRPLRWAVGLTPLSHKEVVVPVGLFLAFKIKHCGIA
jgi:hypothetical protein